MVTNFNQSEKWSHNFFIGLLSVIILILICFLFYSNWKIVQRRSEMETQVQKLDEKIEVLERQKEHLEASIKSNLVEEAARNQMNLKKPGEKVVVVKKPETEQVEKQKEKWWQKWLDKIKFWD